MRNIATMNDATTSPSVMTERTYSGISLSERTALRRERFVDAGINLFGSLGYQATTMRMLTAETGLTNRYFYESFATMEDLLAACYEKLMNDFRHRLQSVLEAASNAEEPARRIRPGLTCFFDAMANPKFARITHSEVLGVSERIDKLYSRYSADFAAMMMEYLTSAGKSKIQDDSSQMQYVGAALTGSLINAAIVWMRSNYATPMDEVVDATLKVFIGTVNML